jgi:hypothetical protein
MASFRWSIDHQTRGAVYGAGGTRPGGLGRSGRRADRARAAVGWVCGAGGAGRRGRRCCLAQPGARRRGLRLHAGSATLAAVAGVPKSDGRPVRTMHSPSGRSDPVRGRAAAGRRVPAGRIRPAGVTFPLLSTVDGSRPGSGHDPDQAGRKSTGQHAAARNVPKQPSTTGAPRSQIMGKWASFVGHN